MREIFPVIGEFSLATLTLIRENWSSLAVLSHVSAASLKRKPNSYKILSETEREYLRTIQGPSRRESFLMGRLAAKRALNSATGHCFSDVSVVPGVFRQPIVYYGKEPGNHGVSISHTSKRALAIAFQNSHPMAIDIEEVDSERASEIKGVLSRKEGLLIQPFQEIESAFFIWGAKEGLSKVLKCGLTTPLEILEVQSIERYSNGYQMFYKNFPQYRALAWLMAGQMVTITLPAKTKIEPIIK